MWRSSGNNLSFVEGDWGIAEIVNIHGIEVTTNDSFKFIFKKQKNGSPILEKEFTSPDGNALELVLTEQESQLFIPGNYVYSLDWYQNGHFMCNIIECGGLKVVDKA